MCLRGRSLHSGHIIRAMATANSMHVNWRAVETVLLDMDGTLLDLRFDTRFWREVIPEHYGRAHGMSYAAAREKLTPVFRGKEGTLDWYRLDYWSRELGIDVTAIKRDCADLVQLHHGVIEFLEQLIRDGKRVLLVTNADSNALSIKMERTGIADYFESLYSAHDFGVPKQEPAFWPLLRKDAAYDDARALLVDDTIGVLQAARRAGVSRQIAIRCPDTGAPARDFYSFDAVDGVSDLFV